MKQSSKVLCPKCKGLMLKGQALLNTLSGMPDFPGDKFPVTLSHSGKGKLIPVLKCKDCGHSISI